MSPTTVQPPDPSSVTPTLDISVASREQLKELLPYQLGRYRLMELIGEAPVPPSCPLMSTMSA